MDKLLHDIMRQADAVIITAGAGMGVDSGLPDFRGKEGLWKQYPALKAMGVDFQEMANPEWFVKRPELAWAFYGHRLHQYNETKPHAGFDMLLDYVKRKNDNYFVIIEIGAGIDLPSIRRLSESLAVHKNTRLIRINPRHDTAPPSAISIRAGGLDGIKTLIGDY